MVEVASSRSAGRAEVMAEVMADADLTNSTPIARSHPSYTLPLVTLVTAAVFCANDLVDKRATHLLPPVSLRL